MKNFIFKSKTKYSDLYKIEMKLTLIQAEQRHARSDLMIIRNLLQGLLPGYSETPAIEEGFESIDTITDGKLTSHQTDLEEHDSNHGN